MHSLVARNQETLTENRNGKKGWFHVELAPFRSSLTHRIEIRLFGR
jgi:hypothetical protein